MTAPRTFDGSTGTPYDPPAYPSEGGGAQHYADDDAVGPVSSLDLLIQSVQAQEAEEEELFGVEVPGLDVRLMCSLDFPYTDWQKWQTTAIPKERRAKPKPTDIRQGLLCSLVLINTCRYVEFKRGAGWEPIIGADGHPMPFAGDEMFSRFGVMDGVSLVRKLFKKDGHLLRAGMRVVNAAGYGDEAEERAALEGDDPLG